MGTQESPFGLGSLKQSRLPFLDAFPVPPPPPQPNMADSHRPRSMPAWREESTEAAL